MGLISEKHCEKCGQETICVLDSRAIPSYDWLIRRRRMCKNCGFRFTTYEIRAKDIKAVAYQKYGSELRDKLNSAFKRIMSDFMIDDAREGKRIAQKIYERK